MKVFNEKLHPRDKLGRFTAKNTLDGSLRAKRHKRTHSDYMRKGMTKKEFAKRVGQGAATGAVTMGAISGAIGGATRGTAKQRAATATIMALHGGYQGALMAGGSTSATYAKALGKKEGKMAKRAAVVGGVGAMYAGMGRNSALPKKMTVKTVKTAVRIKKSGVLRKAGLHSKQAIRNFKYSVNPPKGVVNAKARVVPKRVRIKP